MGKMMIRGREPRNLWLRLAFAALTNGYVKGFVTGRIFTGPSKQVCLPGLNCYSCPGALGACPIGGIQAVLADRNFSFPFYVLGFLTIVGAFLGRIVCGWLCPFGLFQDLLHKIPLGKKYKEVKGEKYLIYLKYVILAVFVILLPMLVLDFVGQGEPWFCKWICPSGTLMAGWPLVIANEGIREAAGWLFAWKNLILFAIIGLSVVIFRPFCRFLCPLGAIYGFFNNVSAYRHLVDEKRCTRCGVCQKTCKMNIPVYDKPNSSECIRCRDCIQACPEQAITATGIKEKKCLQS